MMRDHLDPVLGQALEDEYRDRIDHDMHVRRGAPPRPRTALVTVVVGIAVAVGAVCAIQAGRGSAPAVSPTSSSSSRSEVPSEAALLKKLPRQAYGKVVHTWTARDAGVRGPFDIHGDTAVLAGVCAGGGAVEITDARGSAHKLSCTKLTVQNTFWRFNLGGDGKSTTELKPIHVGVKILSGTPQFIVRLWAVDPRILDADEWSIAATSRTVPRSLRTCTAADFESRATLESGYDPSSDRSSFSARVALTSRSSTDCAVRSWPTMRFHATGGERVGPVQGADSNGRSLDSTEGTLNKYGEFPPARLRAGGHVYLLIQLFALEQLQKDDAQQKAAPTPTTTPAPPMPPLCHPRRIGSIELTIGDAHIAVAPPTEPVTAACQSEGLVIGVNPVVAFPPDFE